MDRKRFFRKSMGGFTLIEVLVVIAILATLAAIALPIYNRLTQTANETVDLANVKILNNVTTVFAMKQEKTPQTVFLAQSTDAARMEVLVTNHYLTEPPKPAQQAAAFRFNQDVGQWFLSFDGETDVLFKKVLSSMDLLKVISGKWEISDGQLIPSGSGENRILLEGSNGTDYDVQLRAVYLDGNPGSSGYGVYYHATEEKNISGYCFQYDPGIGNDFVVRTVKDGKESAPIQRVDMAKVMGKDFKLTDPHDIRIELVGIQQTILVDGVKVMSFEDKTYAQGSVGLRTWGATKAVFQEMSVSQGEG